MGDCPNAIVFSVIKIRLDGPFIILPVKSPGHPHNVQGITAFVPVDPMLEKTKTGMAHKFFLDGVEKGEDNGTPQFEYTLDPDRMTHVHKPNDPYALESFMIPNIHPCFDEFTVSPRCVKQVGFVKLNLPCPDRILLTRGFTPVTFEADGHSSLMPLNHVLEYQVHHPNCGINLRDEKSGYDNFLCPTRDTFVFEAGLLLGADPESQHAVDFFNRVVLGCFGGVADKRLESIQPGPHQPKGLSVLSTDVECSNGGVIGHP